MNNGPTVDEIMNDLKNLETEIEEAKREDAQLQGRIAATKEGLKKDFGVSSLKGAEQLRDNLKTKRETEEQSLISEYNTLKSNYEW